MCVRVLVISEQRNRRRGDVEKDKAKKIPYKLSYERIPPLAITNFRDPRLEHNFDCTLWTFLNQVCFNHTLKFILLQVDPDCQTGFVCKSHKCVEAPDPCIPNPCGTNAICTRQGIEGYTCSCPSGFLGDPKVNCIQVRLFCVCLNYVLKVLLAKLTHPVYACVFHIALRLCWLIQ